MDILEMVTLKNRLLFLKMMQEGQEKKNVSHKFGKVVDLTLQTEGL